MQKCKPVLIVVLPLSAKICTRIAPATPTLINVECTVGGEVHQTG